jgi:hypothetical protein
MTTKHHSNLTYDNYNNHGNQKKGAIQMSLGMIVSIVFAVVLLITLLTWLSGVFSGITELTIEVTAIAKQNLIDDLETSGRNVGVAAPAISDWPRGNVGSFTLAVENENPDQLTTYYYHIYLEAISGELRDNEINDVISGTSETYIEESSTWLINFGAIDVAAGVTTTSDVILSPPSSAPVGIYQFRVAVCTDDEDNDCHSATGEYDTPSTTLYGSDQFGINLV